MSELKSKIWRIVRWAVCLVFAVFTYNAVLSVIFFTDSDRMLFEENKMYEDLYSEMRTQERMLRGTIRGLELRDDEIYNNVFSTSVPSIDDLSSDLLSDDAEDFDEKDISKASALKISKIELASQSVEENFRKVFELCGEEGFSMPPMTVPLEGFNVARTGASIGNKISPFYKVATVHDGLDLIAPVGTKVLAGGAGVVMKVERSNTGDGNVVTIDHGNGYVTKYAHLATITVASGKKVKAGAKIGTVGISGKSFAPHLHYIVLKDGKVCDPVNYMFSSISPQDYATMLVLSGSTAQQMD